MSNKLQVIDSTKLNDLLNAFERDCREKKLLEGILDPKLLQLRESYDKMNNKRNKDIYEKEADVVNFLSKSKKYKDSKNIPVPALPADGGRLPADGAPAAPPPPPPPLLETNVQRREKNFDRYLRTNRIQIQGVNREDLVKDVAGGATTRLNLTPVERRTVLRAFALSNVPVSQIYNPTYKKEYQNIRTTVRPVLTPPRAGTPTTSRSAPLPSRPRSRFLPTPPAVSRETTRVRSFLDSLDLRRL